MIILLFYCHSGGSEGGEMENVHGNSSVIEARI